MQFLIGYFKHALTDEQMISQQVSADMNFMMNEKKYKEYGIYNNGNNRDTDSIYYLPTHHHSTNTFQNQFPRDSIIYNKAQNENEKDIYNVWDSLHIPQSSYGENKFPNTHWNHYQEQGTHKISTVENLWNKINNIDTNNRDSNEDNYLSSSTWSSSSSFRKLNHNKNQYTTSTISQKENNIEEIITTIKPHQFNEKHTNIKPNRPSDVGRGDIGPEQSVPNLDDEDEYGKQNTLNFYTTSTSTKKPHKTAQEIEALSLIKDINNDNKQVTGYTDKTYYEKIPIDMKEQKHSTDSHNYKINDDFLVQSPKEFDYGQQLNDDKQSDQVFIGDTGDLNHKPVLNYGSQLQTSLQPNENIEQSDVQQLEQHKLNPNEKYENNFKEYLPSTDEKLESQSLLDFGQELQNSWQPNENFGQSDVQQLETFDKILKNKHDKTTKEQTSVDENLESQSLLDFGQESQTSWQPNENFGQSDVQQLETFDKILNDKHEKTTKEEQTSVDENLESQSLLDFGQQSQTAWQPNENFEQNDVQQLETFDKILNDKHEKITKEEQTSVDENLESQSLLDFGQQSQTAWQPNENFEQGEFQQLETFGNNLNNIYEKKTEDKKTSINTFDSQSLLDFEKQSQTNDHYQKVIIPQKEIIQHIAENEYPTGIDEQETTTKPSFWKSVGNKITTAKDKVASWFKKN
ncbi:general transcriptional corepressor trfA-like [Leptidea sinapis]|uniref:general transcriptional corepressor trfA-like n=1 Tax=Leptidea sinapis TaxID=189913 RepID=UPI0021C44D14|nr:general transcriptional corepressor trfA-like [Leptidea sinapis]